MNILLSIKPKYAEAILRGEKIWEFRKKIPFHPPAEQVIMYATNPVGLVVGSFSIEKVRLVNLRFSNWDDFSVGAGITEDELKVYADGYDAIYALKAKDPIRFETPKTLADFGVKKAPQSWQYLRG